MKIYKLVLITIFIIVLYNCNNDQNTKVQNRNGIEIFQNFKTHPNEKKLEINIDKVFSLDSSKFFKGNSPSIVIAQNNIYIQDANNIKMYNSNGQFIKFFSGRGNGPGEFDKPCGLYLLNDTLYQTIFASRKVNLFSLEDGYIKTLNIPINLMGGISTLNNKIIASSLRYEALGDSKFQAISNRIVLNKNMGIIKKNNIAKVLLNLKENPSPFGFIEQRAIINNKLYVGIISNNKYEIDIYNDKMIKIGIIKKTYHLKKTSTNENNSYKTIMGMWGDKYNRLWVLVKNNLNLTNQKGYLYFDIFKDGYFLNTIKLKLEELEELEEFKFDGNDLSSPYKHMFFRGKYLVIYDTQKMTFNFYNYN